MDEFKQDDFKKRAQSMGRQVWGEGDLTPESLAAPVIFANGATWGAEEILNWAMQVLNTGSTVGMVRRIMHNKLVELTGKGERA